MFSEKKAVLILLLVISFSLKSEAQLSPGQYLEEAPLGTWNIFGIESGSALGCGFCQLTAAYSGTVGLTNPALLSYLPKANLTFNLGFSQTQLFKYWLVNTGVLTTSGNLFFRSLQINFINFSYRFWGWNVALIFARTENYSRPHLSYQDYYNGLVTHQLDISQAGQLKNYAFSLSRRLNSKLSLGISFIWLDGQIQRNLEESWPSDQVVMIDQRYQKISGFYPLIGLTYRISSRLKTGLSFIPPYHKKVQGQSLLAYRSPSGNTNIEIKGEAFDQIKMPAIISLGMSYSLEKNLDIMLETTYFGWNRYLYSYFGEARSEKFRQVIRLGSGLEYRTTFRFFGRNWDSPYYFGVMIDPQPMTDIKSTYYYLTFGFGLGNQYLNLSLSTAIGMEKGSGRNLKNQKISLTLDLHMPQILRRQK